MHLSISSSNDRLPTGNWIAIWVGSIIVLISTILFFEWHIRSLGWSPSIVDSFQLWAEQRKRASQLGKKAIILVGASRMQLDLDLDILEKKSDLSPVQLAIDGTSYIPVLENLANDPSINGTVLVSVNAYNMRKGTAKDVSTQWVNYYEQTHSHGLEPYRVFHNKIVSLLNNTFITRLEGAKPFTVISALAFGEKTKGNYLITHTDRSREADYQKVKMPGFYAARLERHFGKSLVKNGSTFDTFFNTYEKAIQASNTSQNESFLKNLEYLLNLAQHIENRGGKVVFIRFPTGKLIWEIDKKRYPRKLFWDEIAKHPISTINFIDYSSLNAFDLPDGSHLDYRDKKAFTAGLVDILNNEKIL